LQIRTHLIGAKIRLVRARRSPASDAIVWPRLCDGVMQPDKVLPIPGWRMCRVDKSQRWWVDAWGVQFVSSPFRKDEFEVCKTSVVPQGSRSSSI